ncbi:molybdopterin-dependent oxidoreductase [Nocardioides sp.]|uniref:molybdopterin-dependent oxidoreductase n=1 Tax=Nocardioides sp. TaxID=35761 RepID=UPI0035296EB8
MTTGLPTRPRIPREEDFRSRLRGPEVTSRIGVWLGVCFAVAFLTGVYSHLSQQPDPVIPLPTHPVWLYRLTQGLHVTAGTAAVPLLLVKLWSVFPKLFARPPKELRELALHGAERVSIGVLMAAAIFQLVTGLMNTAQWYPWTFSFRATHDAVAWVAIGALAVHIAVKLPVVRQAFAHDVDDDIVERPADLPASALGRRSLLRTTWVAAGVAVLATAGATVPWLRKVSVLAVRSGDGPGGVPINKSAAAARVTGLADAADYRLVVAHGDRETSLSRADLEAMPQTTAELPIACVEGWSAQGSWTGVRIRELLDLVDAPHGSAVLVTSLQPSGPFRVTRLPAAFADDASSLLALALAGEPLSLDHGYPARVIAPNRPGVLQTKWVARLEVV